MKCSRCDRSDLTEEDFYKTSSGYLYSFCKVCHNLQNGKAKKIRDQLPENKIKKNQRAKQARQNPEKRANVIFTDSKNSDRKHNREFDLTIGFIKEIISSGCFYCGETQLQMTVDRIDNNIGHLQNNVVAACIRCNLIRKAMPYEAWLCLLPGLKEAREKKLFADWLGK
jgi:5-methylcytosine-specific restriction endonuclease McrA